MSWNIESIKESIDYQEVVRITNPSDGGVLTIDDARYAQESGNGVVDGQILVAGSGTMPSYSSANTGFATVNSSGLISYVADGVAAITVNYGRRRVVYQHNSRTISNQTNADLLGYAIGSFSKHVFDLATTWVTERSGKVFHSTRDNVTPNFVRDANAWFAPADLTGIPVAASGLVNDLGVMISPRHIFMTKHITYGNVPLRFWDGTTYHDRTITARLDLAGTDTTIGILNADLPEVIKFYPVLPANVEDYLPSLAAVGSVPFEVNDRIQFLPLLSLNRNGKGVSRFMIMWDSNGVTYKHIGAGVAAEQQNNINQDLIADFIVTSETIEAGDSGHAIFIPTSSGLILMGTHNGDSVSTDPSKISTEINAAMTTLGGGHQLTYADLSAYTDYS